MAGRTIMRIADKEMMDTVLSENHHEVVGIVFNDTFSYQLKFIWGYEIPNMEENSEHAGNYIRIDSIFFATSSNPQLGMTDRNINKVKKRSNILFIPQLSDQSFGQHSIIRFFLPVLQNALKML